MLPLHGDLSDDSSTTNHCRLRSVESTLSTLSIWVSAFQAQRSFKGASMQCDVRPNNACFHARIAGGRPRRICGGLQNIARPITNKVFAFNNLQSLPTEQPTANDDHHHRVDHTETHDKRDAKMPQPLIGEHDSGRRQYKCITSSHRA